MMDDSTLATTGPDTAMHHSAGYTIEQTKQQDRMASRSAQGILSGGRVDSHSLELCKNTACKYRYDGGHGHARLDRKGQPWRRSMRKYSPLQCPHFPHGQTLH